MAENIQLAGLVVDLLLNTASFEAGSTKAQRIANKAAKDIDKEFRSLQGALSGIFARLGPIGQTAATALDQMGSAASAAMSKLGGLSSGLGTMGALVAGLGAAIATVATAITAAMVGIAVRAAESAAKLEDMAKATGVSVEALSRLSAVGHMIAPDIDLDTIAKGLERMDRAALRSIQSTTIASDGFQTLGIKVADAAGHMKSTEALFGEIADKFQNMADGSEKTAVAMEIFGRSGAALIPVLDEGGAEIQRITRIADAFGVTLTGETTEAAHKFKESISELELALLGIENRIMEALLPTMQAVTKALDDMAEGTRYTNQQILNATEGFGEFQLKASTLNSVLHDLVEIVKLWVPILADLGATALIAANDLGEFITVADILLKHEAELREHPLKFWLGNAGTEQMRSEIEAVDRAVNRANNDVIDLTAHLYNAVTLPPQPKTGFDLLDDVEAKLKKLDNEKHHINLDTGAARDQADQLIAKLKALESEIDSLLHKNDTEANKQIDAINKLIAKVEDYEAAWSESFKGINVIGNTMLETLEKQKQAIIDQNDALLKQLGLLAQRNTAGETVALAPSGEAPTLGAIGIPPAPLPEVLTSRLPSEMPVYTGGEAAKQLEAIRTSDQAAQDAADHIKQSIEDENDKYREQMAILEELRAQGKLTQEEFQAAAEKAGAAIVDEWQKAFDHIGNAFQTLINGWLQGTQSLSKAFSKMGDALVTSILSAQMKNLEGTLAKQGAEKSGQPGAAGSIYGVIGKLFGVKDSLNKPDGSASNPLHVVLAGGLPAGPNGGPNLSLLSSLGLGKMPSGISSFLSTAASFLPFAGFMAEGGDVTPGKAYIVGEKRPELFMPRSSGRIIPSIPTGGGESERDTSPQFIFNGVSDADSFKRSQSQMAGWYTRTLYSGRRNG